MNLIAASDAYPECTFLNPSQRGVDRSDQTPPSAALLNQGLFGESGHGIVSAVLWKICVEAPSFVPESPQE